MSINTKANVFILLSFLAVPLYTYGQAYMTESGHVEFTSSVPLHSFTGESDNLIGKINLDDSTVDFYVDMNTVSTGNGKRDKDMRRTLNTEEYPFAEFFGKLVSTFDPSVEKEQSAIVEGEFSVHGVTREIRIDGTLQLTDEGLHVRAGWVLRLEDYEIEPPGILFYRVDQEQEIEIDAILHPVGKHSE